MVIRGNGRGCLGFSPEGGALRRWPSQGLEPGVQYCGSQWIINWTLTEYITMSDLLDNSIIKGLWHVPQKLLLLDRLNVGALHLEELSVLIFFPIFNNFLTHLSDPGDRVKHLESSCLMPFVCHHSFGDWLPILPNFIASI